LQIVQLNLIWLRFVSGGSWAEGDNVCQEVEGDDDPENKDDTSDKDENDQGTKVEHHRSSVKM